MLPPSSSHKTFQMMKCLQAQERRLDALRAMAEKLETLQWMVDAIHGGQCLLHGGSLCVKPTFFSMHPNFDDIGSCGISLLQAVGNACLGIMRFALRWCPNDARELALVTRRFRAYAPGALIGLPTTHRRRSLRPPRVVLQELVQALSGAACRANMPVRAPCPACCFYERKQCSSCGYWNLPEVSKSSAATQVFHNFYGWGGTSQSPQTRAYASHWRATPGCMYFAFDSICPESYLRGEDLEAWAFTCSKIGVPWLEKAVRRRMRSRADPSIALFLNDAELHRKLQTPATRLLLQANVEYLHSGAEKAVQTLDRLIANHACDSDVCCDNKSRHPPDELMKGLIDCAVCRARERLPEITRAAFARATQRRSWLLDAVCCDACRWLRAEPCEHCGRMCSTPPLCGTCAGAPAAESAFPSMSGCGRGTHAPHSRRAGAVYRAEQCDHGGRLCSTTPLCGTCAGAPAAESVPPSTSGGEKGTRSPHSRRAGTGFPGNAAIGKQERIETRFCLWHARCLDTVWYKIHHEKCMSPADSTCSEWVEFQQEGFRLNQRTHVHWHGADEDINEYISQRRKAPAGSCAACCGIPLSKEGSRWNQCATPPRDLPPSDPDSWMRKHGTVQCAGLLNRVLWEFQASGKEGRDSSLGLWKLIHYFKEANRTVGDISFAAAAATAAAPRPSDRAVLGSIDSFTQGTIPQMQVAPADKPPYQGHPSRKREIDGGILNYSTAPSKRVRVSGQTEERTSKNWSFSAVSFVRKAGVARKKSLNRLKGAKIRNGNLVGAPRSSSVCLRCREPCIWCNCAQPQYKEVEPVLLLRAEIPSQAAAAPAWVSLQPTSQTVPCAGGSGSGCVCSCCSETLLTIPGIWYADPSLVHTVGLTALQRSLTNSELWLNCKRRMVGIHEDALEHLSDGLPTQVLQQARNRVREFSQGRGVWLMGVD